MIYTLHQFKSLPKELQLEQLSVNGTSLDLAYTEKGMEVSLFAYHDFYVEVFFQNYTDEIIALKSFKSMHRLTPYLKQIDINEITSLLSYNQ